MVKGFIISSRAFYLLIFVFICALYCNPIFADQHELNKQIQKLEDEFRVISSSFYNDTASYANTSKNTISDIDNLHLKVSTLANSNNSTAAIQLIFFNINTVKNNLDHKSIFTFIELLLENNEWTLANTLFNGVKDAGDQTLLPTIQFIFAKYHAKRNEWLQVNEFLTNIFTELTADNAAYAYLLNGTALQHLKNHRLAVQNYSKVPATSRYFTYAQLNTAIANIRQGWWTDAQTTINNLFKDKQIDNNDELTNRLYLVLGYALLQREYYRDARNAFRKIGLNSRYTNRALLGIGLTATSQGDFVGGLNALSILKDKKTFDLSVDESYLLVPYVYEKLQQEMTVTASYTEAMEYYQRRMRLLENILNQRTDFLATQYDSKTSSLIINNNSLDYSKNFPESFISNFEQLLKFKSLGAGKQLRTRINKLIKEHDKVFQQVIKHLVLQRKEFLKSYLNQSRYGLARLYDSSNETVNQ